MQLGGTSWRGLTWFWPLAVIVCLAVTVRAESCPPAHGSIDPHAIEIDGAATDDPNTAVDEANQANLNQGTAVIKNPGADIDWIKNTAPNTDTPSYCNGVAIGLDPTAPIPTAAAGGTGHWWGVRVVDGADGMDQDIALKGGKVNDPSSWIIGPGSIGSSKYDFTQGYLANNQTTLFAAFERCGNNGTTAFDLEFNQAAPLSKYIPNRTIGDVLFTFLAHGSGKSGYVIPYVFVWDGTMFVPDGAPSSGILVSINDNDSTPGEPWGHVDSKSNWVLGNLDRNTFVEVLVPLALLPNVNVCGGSAWVQYRTRSSETASSDMKDVTPIFEYNFGGPTAIVDLMAGDCDQMVYFDGRMSTLSDGTPDSTGTQLTYAWTFTVTGGTFNANGLTTITSSLSHGSLLIDIPFDQSADVSAQLTVTEVTNCDDTSDIVTVTVLGPPTALAPLLTPTCLQTFTFEGGTTDPKFVNDWTFTVPAGVTLSGGGVSMVNATTYTSSAVSGTVSVGLPSAVDSAMISGSLELHLAPAALACLPAGAPIEVTVYRQLSASATLEGRCDARFVYSSVVTGGTGNHTYYWQFIRDLPDPAADVPVGSSTSASGVFPALSDPELTVEGSYYAILTVTDPAIADVKPECQADHTSNAIDVRYTLTASATKQTPVAPSSGETADSAYTVTVMGSTNALGGDTVSLQWQQKTGPSTWTDIVGETGTSLTLSLADLQLMAGTGTNVAFTISENGDPENGSYVGKMWMAEVRLHAVRLLNGIECPADSSGVTVKALKAVDP